MHSETGYTSSEIHTESAIRAIPRIQYAILQKTKFVSATSYESSAILPSSLPRANSSTSILIESPNAPFLFHDSLTYDVELPQ